MADNNFNIIKPVEGLQNIAIPKSVKGREERKRGNNPASKRKNKDGQLSKGVEEENTDGQLSEDERDSHIVDYQA